MRPKSGNQPTDSAAGRSGHEQLEGNETESKDGSGKTRKVVERVAAYTGIDELVQTALKTDAPENETRSRDDNSIDERRKILHEVTQPTRFDVVQILLMHPKQMASFEEISFVLYDKGKTTIRGHLETLIEIGVVEEVPVPEEEVQRDLPRKYYRLTESGRSLLEHFDLLSIEDSLQLVYDNMQKPEKIRRYEEAERPDPSDVNTVQEVEK